MSRYRQALYNDLTNRCHDNFTNVPFDEFCLDFFYYPVGDQKRLRNYGNKILKKIYPIYEVKWSERIAPAQIPVKHIIWLSNKCTQLYYVGINSITLYDKDEAIMFKMCDADLEIISST